MPASARYSVGLEYFASGECDLIDDDIRVLACVAGYVAAPTTDGYYAGANPDFPDGWLAKADGTLVAYNDSYYSAGGYSDINTDSSTSGVGNPLTNCKGYAASSLATKSVTAGKFDAADPLFVALPGAVTLTQFVVTKFQQIFVNVSNVAYQHVPLALITKKSDGTDISYPTGGGLDLLVRWENVAPFIFEV